MLDQINNLMNFDEIVNYMGGDLYYDEKPSEEIKTSFEILEPEEIVEKLENRINFVISVLPSTASYNKIFYNYFYISKHCFCIYNIPWSEPALEAVAKVKLENYFESSLLGSMTMLCLEIHNSVTTLGNIYKEKIKTKIEISSKNLFEMIDYYIKYQQAFSNYLNSQNVKLNNAISSISRSQEILQQCEETIEKNTPLIKEKDSQIDIKRQEINKKKNMNTALTSSIQEDEKFLNKKQVEKDNIEGEIDDALSSYKDKIMIFENNLKKMDNNSLIEIRNSNENMVVCKFVIGQIYAMSGESSEWDFFKKNVDIKYLRNAIPNDYRNIEPNKKKSSKKQLIILISYMVI